MCFCVSKESVSPKVLTSEPSPGVASLDTPGNHLDLPSEVAMFCEKSDNDIL